MKSLFALPQRGTPGNANKDATAGLLPLYKRYRELGGKYCTLGSDAHYKEHVGRRLQEALALAAQAELTPVYFKARKMQIMEGLK